MGRESRFLLKITRSRDGRLSGALESIGTSTSFPFSGTLELLKAIEDALARPAERAGNSHTGKANP